MRSAIFLAGALIAHAINPNVDIPLPLYFLLCVMLGLFVAADVVEFLKPNSGH